MTTGSDPPENAEAGARVPPPGPDHYVGVINSIVSAEVVPFLGAGASLCGPQVTQDAGQPLPPSSKDLVAVLAKKWPGGPSELARASEYLSLKLGTGPLYNELHRIFDVDFRPSPVHTFLAAVAAELRNRGAKTRQLIVTTNYDDALERAFKNAGETFELVSYMADGNSRGKFIHWSAGGGERNLPIEKPNKYTRLALETNTVILKMHGTVARTNADHDSYVITEDHYIDYLAQTQLEQLIPVNLLVKLRNTNFLFLGYSLKDWNLRVILHRIRRDQARNYRSWAIQRDPDVEDSLFWRDHGVDIFAIDLADYIAKLSKLLWPERTP